VTSSGLLPAGYSSKRTRAVVQCASAGGASVGKTWLRACPSSIGDYIRAVLGQRRTLEPDGLEIARRDGRQSQPAVMLVEDAIASRGPSVRVKLYHTLIMHTSGMLVGYVPDARVLFTADLVSDTFPLNPAFASPVHELIQEKGLSVEMIACGRGNAYAQLAYVLWK